ncbi:S-adenosyl-L-methionine-dependent methyltransferase [Mycena olivaceomarginata]|nr:S-adenosyl-L-methionine-dependent methyltransferase [Mycena olivaceomarginata]
MAEVIYTLKTAQETTEKNRLDDFHLAIRDYLNSEIAFGPQIYGTSPKRILELGCGSGAWALDAAMAFPDAEVIAVDSSPTLKGMALPKNMHFQILDVTQDLPFNQSSFDVVHTRFLLMHVPNAQDVLERAARLVKPGGWLVVEDLNLQRIIDTGGPVVSRAMAMWAGIVEARGADAHFGRKMESIIRNTELFSEIHAQKILIPLCNHNSAMARLAASFNLTLKKLVDDWSLRFPEYGITREVAEQYSMEMDRNSPDRAV